MFRPGTIFIVRLLHDQTNQTGTDEMPCLFDTVHTRVFGQRQAHKFASSPREVSFAVGLKGRRT
jgi:hypothetical protein